jgi:hypothetical protein
MFFCIQFRWILSGLTTLFDASLLTIEPLLVSGSFFAYPQ